MNTRSLSLNHGHDKPTDAVFNAAIRLRAIRHNREVGSTPSEQKEWDERVSIAETHLEAELINSNLMDPEDAIEEISIEGHDVTIVFEGCDSCIILHLPCK